MSTNKVLHGPVSGVWAIRPPHPGTRMGSLSQSATKFRASVSVDGLRLPFLSSELENENLILQSYLISIHLVMILRKPGQCGNARTGDGARWAGPAKQWTDRSAARRGTAVGELDRWAAGRAADRWSQAGERDRRAGGAAASGAAANGSTVGEAGQSSGRTGRMAGAPAGRGCALGMGKGGLPPRAVVPCGGPAASGGPRTCYFFWTYLRQSSVTAARMMMPENTNCRLVSMPRIVSE